LPELEAIADLDRDRIAANFMQCEEVADQPDVIRQDLFADEVVGCLEHQGRIGIGPGLRMQRAHPGVEFFEWDLPFETFEAGGPEMYRVVVHAVRNPERDQY
jgi:hypothetical protein